MKSKRTLFLLVSGVTLTMMAIRYTAGPAESRPRFEPELDEWVAPPAAALRPNPQPPHEASIQFGRQVYRESCLGCHGAGGHGDGPNRWSLPKHPRDLTQLEVMEQTDGTLHFKIVTGRHPMPGFGTSVGDSAAWDVVNFLRTMGPGSRPTPITTDVAQ